jgi:hypothetical protein
VQLVGGRTVAVFTTTTDGSNIAAELATSPGALPASSRPSCSARASAISSRCKAHIGYEKHANAFSSAAA